MKYNQGFSILEIFVSVVAIGCILLYKAPTIATIKADSEENKRLKIVCQLENAKDKFDREAKPEERRKFDAAKDSEKFNKLQPILNVIDATAFWKDAGITELKINKLGVDVETITTQNTNE